MDASGRAVMSDPPPVAGLILAGGRSSRMGRDKATLIYRDRDQLHVLADQLSAIGLQPFVSIRTDQRDEPLYADFRSICDRYPDGGPMAALLSAFAFRSQAWLAVAVDLPQLQGETLAHLLANRQPARAATAYRIAGRELPEPLCAIWEPAAHGWLGKAWRQGQRSPSRLLQSIDAYLLPPPDPWQLANANTPQHYRRHRASLRPGGATEDWGG
jgi:molybdopterin-guanine dinucleotide biosynthesis protein A